MPLLSRISNIKKSLKGFLFNSTSPEGRALGVSLGIFSGFLPFIGFQSLFLAIFSLIKRVDRFSLLLGYQMAKLTPFPLFLWGEYKLGSLLIGGPSLTLNFFKNLDPSLFKILLLRFLIGGTLLATLMMLISFTVVYSFLKIRIKPLKG
jgi:uncharacterized protein (DUF2062 family)